MHRPGHVDSSSDGTESMDRRKYLSTLAAGAAFGTVAVGIAACSTQTSDNKEGTDTTTQALVPSAGCNVIEQWGRITLFPPNVHTATDALNHLPAEDQDRIQIPFFNNTGTQVSPGDIVGVHLIRIGCPEPQFVVAFNIEKETDHPMTDDEKRFYEDRNLNQNTLLENLGYLKKWHKPQDKPCPEPPRNWKYDTGKQ